MNFPFGETAVRFETFHRENPLVYETLVRLVAEWVAQHGYSRLGIRMLWEHARWELIRETSDPYYKLNDHFTSYYVRLLLAENPDYDGLFELRRSPADAWIINRFVPNVVGA